MRKNVVMRALAIVICLGLAFQPVTVMAANKDSKPPIELKERNPKEKFLNNPQKINREELIPSSNPKGIDVPTDPIIKPTGKLTKNNGVAIK